MTSLRQGVKKKLTVAMRLGLNFPRPHEHQRGLESRRSEQVKVQFGLACSHHHVPEETCVENPIYVPKETFVRSPLGPKDTETCVETWKATSFMLLRDSCRTGA